LPNRCIAHFPPYQLVPIAEMLAESGFLDGQSDFAIDVFIDHERCDTMVMIAAREKPALFAKLAATIAAGQIHVVAAHAFSLGENKVLDVFHIQTKDKQPLMEPHDLTRLQSRIASTLQDDAPLTPPNIPFKPNVLMERVPVRVRSLPLASFTQTAIEVAAADRPGLLAALTYTITQSGFSIHGAAISSFGERIVDVFFVQDHGKQLDEAQITNLCAALEKVATLEKAKAE